jgi:hypothetical protein
MLWKRDKVELYAIVWLIGYADLYAELKECIQKLIKSISAINSNLYRIAKTQKESVNFFLLIKIRNVMFFHILSNNNN